MDFQAVQGMAKEGLEGDPPVWAAPELLLGCFRASWLPLDRFWASAGLLLGWSLVAFGLLLGCCFAASLPWAI
jgi:hypothetical protein